MEKTENSMLNLNQGEFWFEITGKELNDTGSNTNIDFQIFVNKLKSKGLLPEKIIDSEYYNIFVDENDNPQFTVAIQENKNKSVINFVRGIKEDGLPLDEYSDKLISFLKDKSDAENVHHYLNALEHNKRLHDYKEQIENGTLSENEVPKMIKDVFGYYDPYFSIDNKNNRSDVNLNRDKLLETIRTSPSVKKTIANYYGCPEEDAIGIFNTEGKIIEFNLLLDRFLEGRYEFSKDDVKELIQLIIEANSNDITKELLSKKYENVIEDPIEGTSHYYPGNLYTKMVRIRPILAQVFECNQDEIGIAVDNAEIGKVNTLKTLSILEGRHITEEIPYKVFIGDGDVSGKKIPEKFNPSIEQLEVMIGNLNLSGYKGKISDSLSIVGDLIADEETEIKDIDGLYIGGKVYGLQHLVSKPEDLEGIRYMGDISEDTPPHILKWLDDIRNSNSQNGLEFTSEDIKAASVNGERGAFLSASNYRTTSKIFESIMRDGLYKKDGE